MSASSLDEQIALLNRGASEIISEADLRAKLEKSRATGKPLRVKLGVDPTAASVTLGWAVVLRKLRDFQRLGHQAHLIIGDFTARIGDPAGRSKTRPQLDLETIRGFVDALLPQFYKILSPELTTIRYNGDWLGAMTFADVIRLASKTTIARVMERDDFTKRWNQHQPLHLHEILYPLCQAQDSVAIKADVELGGNDQKFNILMGRDLQREVGQESQVAVLSPILVGTDGVDKMSQSLGNYIGITEDAHNMYGKVMSIPDDIVKNYFELATDVPLDEVRKISADVKNGSLHAMDAKKRLAREITALYHDEAAARKAEERFISLFSKRDEPDDAPELAVPAELVVDGHVNSVSLLVRLGMAESNSAARRLIEQGGVRINNEKLASTEPIPSQQLAGALLKVGKLRYARLKL